MHRSLQSPFENKNHQVTIDKIRRLEKRLKKTVMKTTGLPNEHSYSRRRAYSRAALN
jgi:hypothetical protein